MPTSEEIGQAIEDATIRRELNRTPYDNLHSDDIITDTQLNQRIMRPEWDSKLIVMKPKVSIEECYTYKLDYQGEPILHNGKKVVLLKEVKVFEGFKTEELDLPVKNLFKADLTTAISSPTELALINKMSDFIFHLVELSLATEEDYSYDIYKFYNVLGSILNTSKSRGGKTLEMLKTQINKGEQTSTIKQMMLEDQRRKGLFGKIKGIFGK
jgi:hypothetical protein